MSDDREKYISAIIRSDIECCIRIEKEHGLFGYTPELVCIGLSAIAQGQNAIDAIESYTEEVIEECCDNCGLWSSQCACCHSADGSK